MSTSAQKIHRFPYYPVVEEPKAGEQQQKPLGRTSKMVEKVKQEISRRQTSPFFIALLSAVISALVGVIGFFFVQLFVVNSQMAEMRTLLTERTQDRFDTRDAGSLESRLNADINLNRITSNRNEQALMVVNDRLSTLETGMVKLELLQEDVKEIKQIVKEMNRRK